MTIPATRELIITVPHCPPSVLLPNKKRHWAVKNRAAQQYSEEVKLCAMSARNEWEEQYGKKWQTLEHATLQFICTFKHSKRGPLPDKDNLDTALKSARDALTARERGDRVVGAGLIVDDSPDHVRLFETLIGRGEDESIRIIIRGEPVKRHRPIYMQVQDTLTIEGRNE